MIKAYTALYALYVFRQQLSFLSFLDAFSPQLTRSAYYHSTSDMASLAISLVSATRYQHSAAAAEESLQTEGFATAGPDSRLSVRFYD